MRSVYVIARDRDSFIRAANEKYPGAVVDILESVNLFTNNPSPNFSVIEGRAEINYILLTWDRAYDGDISYIVAIENPANWTDGKRMMEYLHNNNKIHKFEIWEDPCSPEAAKRRVNELATLGS